MSEQETAPEAEEQAEVDVEAQAEVVTEVEAEAPAQQGDEAVEAEEAANSEEAEPPKPNKKTAQERISELVRQREEARQQAESERHLRMQAEQQLPRSPSGPPQEDQFDSYDDFVVAKAEYKILQRQQEQALQYQQQQQIQAQHEARIRYRTQAEMARDKYEDFDQVVNNPNLPITEHMAQAIAESDQGADVAYHLGKNPQEAQRIAGLSPLAAARELGRIEAALTAPTPKKVTTAPKPPPSVGQRSGGSQKAPKDMSYEEYRAYRGFA